MPGPKFACLAEGISISLSRWVEGLSHILINKPLCPNEAIPVQLFVLLNLTSRHASDKEQHHKMEIWWQADKGIVVL